MRIPLLTPYSRAVWLFLLLALLACGNDPNDVNIEKSYESDMFEECNFLMKDCRNGLGAYCLNGFKWGQGNPLTEAGESVTGPKEPGGEVSYSFQEQNGVVNTHAEIDLPSQSFSELAPCAKEEIKRALASWSSVANISFVEDPENSDSDIRFFVADIRQSGVGFPNFPDVPCTQIGGDMVTQTDLWSDDCELMYLFFLHEIGHVLGLGHVGSTNIMNASFSVIGELDGLGGGDIRGIRQLYGERD